jgi:hypothetical protein
MLKFEFLVDSPVTCEHQQYNLNKKATGLLERTLKARTYYGSIINELPYDDAAATSDARQFFNAGMMCCINEDWDEALMWWAMGDKLWSPSNVSVMFERNNDVQVKADTLIHQAVIVVDSWTNTMYGSSRTQTDVAYLYVKRIEATKIHERLEELKWQWLDHIENKRKQIRADKAHFAEMFNLD